MKRALLITLASIALFAKPAISEIFKCVDASGNVTFVNDRSACPDAKPHPLKGRVDRASSAAALAEEAEPDLGEISSPEPDPSRNMNSWSGETTKGGLETMRSKVSPRTGSSRLPLRHSMLSNPLRAAPAAVHHRARGLMSVATTLVACLAASNA